jgi:Bax protein
MRLFQSISSAEPFFAKCIAITARNKACLASQIKQQPIACAVALCVLIIVATAIVDTTAVGARTKDVHSIKALQDYYRELGYVEHAVYSGEVEVPRIYLSGIPGGWAADQSVAVKKSVFFRAMLPLVLKVNEDIKNDRLRLKRIAATYDAHGSVDDGKDRTWLRRLAVRYEVVDTAEADMPNARVEHFIAPLLSRVDTIPPSLALAQAAVESGYGSSRFAVEGNALYGQWRTGGGLRPRAQPEHLSNFGIATFLSPLHSVAAYAHNLNTFPAYRDFRAMRTEQSSRAALNSQTLTDTLTAYSQRGEEYVATVKSIIRFNQLSRFDGVRLEDGKAVILHLSQDMHSQRRAL